VSSGEDVGSTRREHTTSDTPLPRQLRPAWELPEKLAGAMLASTGVLLVAGVAAGVTVGVEGSEFPAGSNAATRIFEAATTWAGISVVLVLFVALALLWWNSDGWVDVLDEWQPTDAAPMGNHAAASEPNDLHEDDVIAAVGHLQRTRWLAMVTAIALTLTTLAAIGYAVADTVNLSDVSYDVAPLIVLWGAVAALVTLSVAGLVAVRALRHRCRHALEFDDSDDDSTEALEHEGDLGSSKIATAPIEPVTPT
jgi:hypothetical protein